MEFFACEIGQRYTNAYDAVFDVINRFDWYLFPTKIHRMLPVIMIYTQRPIEILCFGSAASDRNTFKQVGLQHQSTHLIDLKQYSKLLINHVDYEQRILVLHDASKISKVK